jgi:hypothetical protein
MVGRRSAILDYLKRWGKEGNLRSDDQFFWTHAYLHSKKQRDLPRIEIDHHYRLSCCMYNQEVNILSAKDGIVFIKNSGIRPCLLHFNGPSKGAMNSVAKQLGYSSITL